MAYFRRDNWDNYMLLDYNEAQLFVGKYLGQIIAYGISILTLVLAFLTVRSLLTKPIKKLKEQIGCKVNDVDFKSLKKEVSYKATQKELKDTEERINERINEIKGDILNHFDTRFNDLKETIKILHKKDN